MKATAVAALRIPQFRERVFDVMIGPVVHLLCPVPPRVDE
jgi:hypothetical protein